MFVVKNGWKKIRQKAAAAARMAVETILMVDEKPLGYTYNIYTTNTFPHGFDVNQPSPKDISGSF